MPRTTLTMAAFALTLMASRLPAAPPVDYSRDVKPILAANCYACHGPDEGKRKGKLRLDVRDAAIKKAIKPGDAAGSSLIERLETKEPREVMPPPSAKKPALTAAQVDTLKRWINEGAKFESHWAYIKPTAPALPEVKNAGWVRNPIDRFVLHKLESMNWRPAPEADRTTLARRLSFDLIGLPPTVEEVDALLNDKSSDAYDKQIDRLLASKHFGERLAVFWLDLVRFADTGGYHSDNHRDIHLYRDNVINAFNQNKRFDRFTIEQLAGDLLPDASQETRIASGYNRVLMTTEEGGAQPKEYMAKYSADRVRNVSSVWLAATLGCAECHDHKFDPLTTRDFYSMAAFFADVREAAVGRQAQDRLPTPAQTQKLAELDQQIAALQKRMATPEVNAGQVIWEFNVTAGRVKGLPKNVSDVLAIPAEKRNAQQKQQVATFYHGIAPELAADRTQVTALQAERTALDKAIPTTLMTTATNPRMIRILPRGNWLDDSGEVVQPNVPATLPPLQFAGKRASRLDLAQWLVSPEHPLTARVFVNRLWKLCFGQGLVRSPEDFGIQGVLPTHPELLDWLALEFIASGWDVKHLLKLMLTSNTYRQSSVPTKEVAERDPGNLWLARQGRFRIDAELVRDNALAVSGLLARKVGGPSVKPYQPAGYWQFLNFPKRDWAEDRGDDQYRRGLYTYWQRSFLHPSLLAFDAPSREECTVERPRSSTPLQALVLLNDPTYVEAARAFAERILKDGGANTNDRLVWAYRQALSRAPRPEELKILQTLHAKHLEEYTADEVAAQKLLTTGQKPLPQGMNGAELAAWTSVSRVILNLHEAITRN